MLTYKNVCSNSLKCFLNKYIDTMFSQKADMYIAIRLYDHINCVEN